MVVFIGCRLTERKGGSALKAKLPAKKDDLLIDLVKKALRRFRKKDAGLESMQVEDAEVEKAFLRVTSVSCDGCDLTDLVRDPAASLEALNSHDTPLFSSGIDIFLPPLVTDNSTERVKKKPKICSFDVLMRRVLLEESMEFLQWETDIDGVPEISEQIMTKLYSLFEDIDLGYCDDGQKQTLKKNAGHLKNTLCFIQKFWKVLLRADFPRVPDTDDFATSKLITALTTTTRKKARE